LHLVGPGISLPARDSTEIDTDNSADLAAFAISIIFAFKRPISGLYHTHLT
jgi:hypothetical protein